MLMQLLRKELQEQVFSLKGVIWMLAATLLFSGLSYSFVSIKEMSVLAQEEMVGMFLKVALGFGLLMTLILAAASIAGEREQGTLESLMLTPMAKTVLVFGKWLGAMAVWIIVALLALPYLLALGKGASLTGTILLFLFVFSTIVIGSFTAAALGLSSLLQSSKNAVMFSMALFLLTAVPSFLSTPMKKAGFGKVLDTASPLSGLLNLMKDLFVNKLIVGHAVINSLSVLIFAAMAFAFMAFAARKLSLLGGE